MFLSSPIWLVLLAPWAGLVIWLLRGKFESRAIPFLKLWDRDSAINPRPSRAMNIPPLAVVLLLLAMLLAVAAASGPVMVVSRQSSNAATLPSDISIESLSVRTSPTTQAMICLNNQSDLKAAKLTMRTGETAVSEEINLPNRLESRNYFINLPAISPTVDAEISADQIDHHFQTEVSSAWPMIDARGSPPPEVGRMIEVYSHHRPSREGSRHIFVATASENLKPDETVAILADAQSNLAPLAEIQPLIVRDGPLTRSVDWEVTLTGAKVAAMPSGDWESVVSADGSVVLAYRQNPARQVWIGFDSDEFSHRPGFVILWSNILNWLGGEDLSTQPTKLPNSPALSLAAGGENNRPIAGQLFLAALGLIVISALTWKAPKVGMRNDFKS